MWVGEMVGWFDDLRVPLFLRAVFGFAEGGLAEGRPRRLCGPEDSGERREKFLIWQLKSDQGNEVLVFFMI